MKSNIILKKRLIKTIEQKVHQQNMELANRSKVIEDLKVSLTLLLDKYNELKKNYDKKINTFLVAPMSKNIQNSINKETGRFNSSRLYIEKFTLQLNLKSNNNPLLIQSFKKKISLEEFEKLSESLNLANEQLKDKEKYSKMKDAEIKRLELLVKEYELIKISFEDLNKKHLELKKFNESNKIELDFFKEETERLKNDLDLLLREKFSNQELVNNSRRNYELFLEFKEKLNNLDKICLMKSEEIERLLQIETEQNELIGFIKKENYALKEENLKLKDNLVKLEDDLIKEREKNHALQKKFDEENSVKEEAINNLEKRIEIFIANELKYTDMFRQITEKTKSSYESFHRIYLDQEKIFEKKLKELKGKLDSIKMKIVMKINSKFIEGNNILNNKFTNKIVTINSSSNINPVRKISFQSKFEILGIPTKNNSTNQIIKQTINNNPITNIKISNSDAKREEEIEAEYAVIIDNFKKSINELKNDLKDKLLKIEKHDVEKNKLIYKIQNYERYMKETEKKCNESNEKTAQMELVMNQLNSKIDIMNKENLKVQKNLSLKLREEMEVREEKFKKDYLQQVSDLKNQLQQYKVENQGKSKIIEERNEEIRFLKTQIK